MSKHLEVNIGDNEFIVTPENTSLFTFMGEAALYDHVFMKRERNEQNQVIGNFVFANGKQPHIYEYLMNFIIAEDYPIHMNIREAAECDIAAFEREMFEGFEDGIPDNWDAPRE